MTTYTLHIQYSDRPAQTLTFTNSELIIGRESGDISLGDPMASGHHGKLTLNTLGQTLTYTDLNSSNGSRHLNGQPITEPTPLGPGHAVRIGSCIITVRSIGDSQQRANANRGGTVLGGASPLAGGFLRRPGAGSGPSALTPNPIPATAP
ncbi:MAG: FHA domain-containing protein, partial [Nannocystaceae bacterium]